MGKRRKEHRDFMRLQRDGILPPYIATIGGIGNVERSDVVAEVLCYMPEEDYERLKQADFDWYFPLYETLGEVRSFKKPVVYLSPVIDKLSRKKRLAVAAHEIGHILLGHHKDSGSKKYHEKEVHELLYKWGYEKEPFVDDEMVELETRDEKEKTVEELLEDLLKEGDEEHRE